ncbi:NACHT, LRR and PYD domains-containing protein 3-like [Lepisosteus oculatus]|uniref:NACHT, LRR and PYD domains-containing protein 3-like n=1 Tax=Lepisosteus oculatus TaxID=7918 RepID=UPI003717E399
MSGAEFADRHRAALIQRVTQVGPLADELLSVGMIHQESYSRVLAAATPQDRMRELYSALDSGGETVKDAFYSVLQRDYSHLVHDLDPSAGRLLAPASQTPLTGWLQTLRDKHKAALKRRFEVVSEGVAQPGEQTLLDDVFTHVWITEGSSAEVDRGHEVRQLETVSRSRTPALRRIRCADIFTPMPGQARPIRTVLMKGVAGIGKTFSVRKFIHDWAARRENQDIDFVFFFPFCELNLIRSEISLLELVQCFCPEIQSSHVFDQCKVLFVFDGLDETRLPLKFRMNQRWSDSRKPTSVDTLFTNLLKGNLLIEASVWITSRPAAAGLIPAELVSRVTEVQGFEDQQKEEYIRKKCGNEALAEDVIAHIKTLRSLHMMCYVPVFCWIVVTVLEHTLEADNRDNPRTLTDFYTNFLLVLLTAKEEKEKKENVLEANKEAILKLGRLAFESLEESNIVFYDKDLKEYGIDINNSSLYSGVCREIFKQNSSLFQEKAYCFLHLTVQEYFAALYVFGSYQKSNINPLKKTFGDFPTFGKKSLFSLNEAALIKANKSRNGHLDLFVRFLLGMGMETNQDLLKGFLSNTEDHSSDIEKTAGFIKKLIRETSSPERCLNLFHCLSELKDKSLMDEFNATLETGKLSRQRLSPSQCSALAYFSLLSESEIDDLDMSQYATSEECARRLLPLAKISKSLRMLSCGLTERCCEDLASNLQSPHCRLRELDLSYNSLGDSGVNMLSAALRESSCELEKLKLEDCRLTERCCGPLASALQAPRSRLTELDLSYNKLGDSGVKLLSAALQGPRCNLTILSLSDCGLSARACEDLASAIASPDFCLRVLDLSSNRLGDSGAKLLFAVLRNPDCKLRSLGLSDCGLTDRCCRDLAWTLHSEHYSLRVLNLGENNLGDTAVKLLSAALRDPNSKLTSLRY